MIATLNGFSALLLDYYLAATVLLALVLCAMKLLRQPVERRALAWGTVAGLCLLIALVTLPGWPRISLAPSQPTPAAAASSQMSIPIPAYARPISTPEMMNPTSDQKLKQPMEKMKPPLLAAHKDTSPDPNPAEARRWSIGWTPLAAGLFLLGSLYMLTWQIVGAIQLRRLVASARPAPAFAQDALRKAVATTRGMPRLLVTDRVASAAACGLGRPTILLPADVAANPPASETEPSRLAALLSHEWAHLRGGDLWLLFALRVLSIGLYANPLYWLLRRRVSADQELIADAVASSGCGREQFASYLVEWARRAPQPAAPRAALGIWQRQAELSRRITMLLDERIRLRTACSKMGWIVSATAIIGAVVSLSFVTLRAAPPATPQASVETKAIEEHEVANGPEPAVADTKDVQIVLHGVCKDYQKRPIAGARARLFRFDKGTTQVSRAAGRFRFVEGALPEMAKLKNQEGVLGRTTLICDPASQRVLADIRSDANGRIEFPPQVVDADWKSGASRVYICVQAEGMATEWAYATTDPQAAREPLDFTLPPGVKLQGRVTDQAGRPVAGALVAAGEAGNLPKPVAGLQCAKTDADGRYEITDLSPIDMAQMPFYPANGVLLEYLTTAGWIEHPEFATHVIEFKKLPATVDAVLLQPATLVTRVVRAETGQTIAKAPLNRTSGNGETTDTVCDEHGESVATGLEPGTYTVTTTPTDRPRATESIELKPGPNELVLKVKRGGMIKGRLIDDATGKSITKLADPNATTNSAETWSPQMTVLATIDESDPEQGTGGAVDSKTAEFQFAARPGKNHISVFTFAEMFGASWELADPDRWQKQGVDVAEDQTFEIELRVKAKKSRERDQYAAFARFRDRLADKEPASLQLLLTQLEYWQSIQKETINGKEEIVSIAISPDVGPGSDERDLFQQFAAIAPIEKSLIANLKAFPHLRALYLFHPPVQGDEIMTAIRGLQELEMLYIVDVLDDVTGASVKQLAKLTKLQSLSLLSRKLDDAALSDIARFPALRALTLSGDFTDEGLKNVATNTQLTHLIIASTGDAKFTDAGLAHLAKMTKLKQLELTEVLSMAEQAEGAAIREHWAITDDGLRSLAALNELEELSLHAPQLTDACLVHLRGLKRLKSLSIEGSKITPEGKAELRKFLPDLNPPPKPRAETQQDE